MKRWQKKGATLEIRTEPKKKKELPKNLFKVLGKCNFPKFLITKKMDFSENFSEKNIYFLDITALVHYSGPLYGGFLCGEQFKSQCIVSGENNIFVTDEDTLEELYEMENDSSQRLIYSGYTAFIARNLYIISSNEAANAVMGENILREIVDSTEGILTNEFYAHIMGSLRYLYNNNLDPILISLNDATIENAQMRTYAIYEIK